MRKSYVKQKEIDASKILRTSNQLDYLVPIHRSLMVNGEAETLDLRQFAEMVVNYPLSLINPDDVIATAAAIKAVAIISPTQTKEWLMLLASECESMSFCGDRRQLTKLTLGLTLANLEIVSDIETDVSVRAAVLVPYAGCWQEVMKPIMRGGAMLEHEVPFLSGELRASKPLQQRFQKALKGWVNGMPKWDEDFLPELGVLLSHVEETSKEYHLNSFHYWLVGRLVFAYSDQLALNERIRLLCPRIV